MANRKNAEIVMCAVFAALISVMSMICIPTPSGVPITLQTFAAALCGYYLGTVKASVAVVVYIAIGAVGVPVFSGLRGGIAVLVSPTGGYIAGLAALAAICGISASKTYLRIIFGFVGVIACHACGIVTLSVFSGGEISEVVTAIVMPFAAKDMICVVLALYAAKAVRRSVKSEYQ